MAKKKIYQKGFLPSLHQSEGRNFRISVLFKISRSNFQNASLWKYLWTFSDVQVVFLSYKSQVTSFLSSISPITMP